jgi:hypothetical protein
MTDIFISYSQKDRIIAEHLATTLAQDGYEIWWYQASRR